MHGQSKYHILRGQTPLKLGETMATNKKPLGNIAEPTSDGVRYGHRPALKCRQLSTFIVAACTLLSLSQGVYSKQERALPDGATARADITYPTRPIRLLVPLASGGAVDIVARVIGTYLTNSLGQQIVVDNRPGAGSIIGTEIAAKAIPDGHTLLMHSSTLAVMPSIFSTLPFNPAKDFVPVTSVSSVPFVLVVKMSAGLKSVEDLVAAARSKPGHLNFGSAGIGSPTHLTSELLAAMAGVSVTHVPYKGAPQALTDVMGGRLDFMFASAPLVKPQIEAGRVKGLAVATAKRVPSLPNLPTVHEAGFQGYEVLVWNGLFAPAGIRNDVLAKLSDHVTRALNNLEVRKSLVARGAEVEIMTQAAFLRYFQSELTKWRSVIKRSGATAQ